MAKVDELIGIILAGGQSKRYGEPKAFAKREGKFFYQYSIEALVSVAARIYLVAHPNIKNRFKCNKGVEVIEDLKPFQGYGPLAGIYSVMDEIEAEWYFVLPIDSPFITKQTIEKLLNSIQEGVEAVVPLVNGKAQPLIAVYHRKVKEQIHQALRKNALSVNGLLEHISVKFVEDFNEEIFVNINNRSDYTKYIL
ncbi:molybdenum cofactor guanylyltransferase [Niallia sp. 01092]|uniref:molybdenum cofactor guanylyltransferase n=1 Tax=unclassified Niallia TaxID=2837522 RepID=UPI003FD2B797